PRHHAQGRGLAGAVRPEQRIELAGAHGEVEPVDRGPVEALGKAADLEAVGRAGGEHATLAWMAMPAGYAGSGFGRTKSTRQSARRRWFTKKRARRPPHPPLGGRIALSEDQEHRSRTNVRFSLVERRKSRHRGMSEMCHQQTSPAAELRLMAGPGEGSL